MKNKTSIYKTPSAKPSTKTLENRRENNKYKQKRKSLENLREKQKNNHKNYQIKYIRTYQYPPTGGFWQLSNTQKPPETTGSWGVQVCFFVPWHRSLPSSIVGRKSDMGKSSRCCCDSMLFFLSNSFSMVFLRVSRFLLVSLLNSLKVFLYIDFVFVNV